MPSTHTSLLYHVVYATKNREPVIAPVWRGRLYDYLGGAVRGLGGVSQGIGGMADHVHMLIGLKPTHSLAGVVREVKKASSLWIAESQSIPSFRWQEGYGAFTVSASAMAVVQDYIVRQEEHHRHRTFREEYVLLLQKAGIEFDERYLV
ncbi:MAG: IS200/IS605 family transposase [Puniceicoccaceae bacterium]|nr:MAG: IS200/IS605 family transposase [Puniceicoccaceae bacterium]